MVNKSLDEDKIVIVEMNKRTYHYLTGLKVERHPIDLKLLGERTINSSPSDNNDFKKPCPSCNGWGYSQGGEEILGEANKIWCEDCKGQGFIKS